MRQGPRSSNYDAASSIPEIFETTNNKKGNGKKKKSLKDTNTGSLDDRYTGARK